MAHPAPLSRRQILQTATALGVSGGLFAFGSPASGADAGPYLDGSGLVTGKPKKLKYENIPGLLTKEQVAPHYTAHYGGPARIGSTVMLVRRRSLRTIPPTTAGRSSGSSPSRNRWTSCSPGRNRRAGTLTCSLSATA